MTRKILMLAVAAAFTTVSGFALAQGVNDGPKYPNMESHKQYTDKRNLDHNNASPRYPVMTSNKQAPNAKLSATQIRPGQRVVVRHRVRYPVHATHRTTIYAHHG